MINQFVKDYIIELNDRQYSKKLKLTKELDKDNDSSPHALQY